MVVTDAIHLTDSSKGQSSSALRALTTAALLLPGLQPVLAQQTTDTTAVQVSRFSQAYSADNSLQAWTLDFRTSHALSDRFSMNAGLSQDSWSGATPVAVAPSAFGGNRPVLRSSNNGTVISGASPLVNGKLLLNRALQPIVAGSDVNTRVDNNNELVMSSASPEIRQQIDVGFAFADQALRHSLNLSRSSEPDFRSLHADWHTEFDFNRQQTTLTLGAGYTHSSIDATLDHNLLPYLALDNKNPSYVRHGGEVTMQGTRREQSLELGLTQLLSQSSLLSFSVSDSRSQGLMENPYKAMIVAFVAPELLNAAGSAPVNADVRALPEQRPDSRHQRSVGLRYVQQVTTFDAALHVDYNYSDDDWQIESQSIELQWLQPLGTWMLAPHLRWYSQEAASFHSSSLVSKQGFRSIARNEQGQEIWQDANNPDLHYLRTADGTYLDATGKALDPALLQLAPQFVNFSRALLPANFSSDARLGGFGVLSIGLSLQRHFANGLTLEAGVDHYRRASALQFGGKGDTPYADLSYWSASVGLQADWQVVARHQRSNAAGETEHHHEDMGAMANFPAGLDMMHAPMAAGSLMAGYKLELNTAKMTMHMLEVDYALSERWSLMLMPQFMTMQPHAVSSVSNSTTAVSHMHNAARAEGEPADVVAAALWYLPTTNHDGYWQLSAGLGVPTTAAGTLDLKPALAYSTNHAQWNWGSRLAGNHDLQQHAAQDHEPHSSVELSAWVSTRLNSLVSTSLRGVYSHSNFASDFATTAANRTALGIGLSILFAGQPLSLEWLQPLSSSTGLTGISLHGSLFAAWHHGF